jgi:hypothetical protein
MKTLFAGFDPTAHWKYTVMNRSLFVSARYQHNSGIVVFGWLIE